ncbi:hypothetical protein PVAP13_4KG297000 [Panicum virgatum]|uniref:Uncharacterized protein n=1 Tax=Panicum virgatum TaxID=38727 RepID=A0A8T0TKS2_PANVG|nr:hypothetical protein PVAP13_4KG297000 [Panicum virgatum]
MVPDKSFAAGAVPPSPPATSDGDRPATPPEDTTSGTGHENCFQWLWDLIKNCITGGPQHDRPAFRPIDDPPKPPGTGRAASER